MREPSAPEAATDASPVRILIVDPDPRCRRRVIDIATAAAGDVRRTIAAAEASDGVAALASVGEHRAQLVLTEVLLERLSGMALLRRLKADRGDTIAVMLVTALDRDTDRYWALRNGADAFVAKPYADAELRARLRRFLDNRRALERLTPGR